MKAFNMSTCHRDLSIGNPCCRPCHIFRHSVL